MDPVVGDSNSDFVVLEFGFHGPRCGQDISDEQRAQLATQVTTFRQTVNHLDENPSYSAGIRGLTVRLLCLEGTPAQDEKAVNAFRDLVLCIIEYLPNLKVFRWATLDSVVPLADDIVDALIARRVEQFFMPVTRIGDSDLSRLRGLNTLSLGLQWHERTEGFGFYHNHTDAFPEWQAVIVRENASTIQHLAVTASIRWQCDLPALKEAAFVRLLNASPATMGRLLRTSPHLTSLTLIGTESKDRKHTPLETAFKAFTSAPDALPQLASFKLLASLKDSGVTDTHGQAVAMFLKNKALLRRLHVVLSSGHRSLYGSILEVLPTLPSLEVLGVQLNCDTLDADELRFYDVHLPRALTSLLVLARFGTVKVSPEELLSIFMARD